MFVIFHSKMFKRILPANSVASVLGNSGEWWRLQHTPAEGTRSVCRVSQLWRFWRCGKCTQSHQVSNLSGETGKLYFSVQSPELEMLELIQKLKNLCGFS